MQKKKQKATELTDGATIAWTGRLEVPLLEALKPHAKKGRRSIAAQINLVIEEWLQTHRLPAQPQVATETHQTASHPVQNRTAKASAVPPADPNAIKALVEDDEGWEGTDPAVLGGTSGKVKI